MLALALGSLALFATACGDGDENAANQETPSSSQETGRSATVSTPTSESPATTVVSTIETTTPSLTVSIASTCQLLFNDDPAWIDRALNLLSIEGGYAQSDVRKLSSVVEDLEFIGSTAGPRIKPLVEATVAPVRQIRDNLQTGVNETVDLQGFRAAGYDLLDRCTPYIR